MAVTPLIQATVPDDVMEAARAKAGNPDIPNAELVRLALCEFAGIPVPVMRKGGRPRWKHLVNAQDA